MSAQQFKVTATGTISSISNYGGGSYFDPSVAIGTPFAKTFFFDFAATKVSAGNPTQYDLISVANGETIGAATSYGHHQFLADSNFQNLIDIYKNPNSGLYDVGLDDSAHFVNSVNAPFSFDGKVNSVTAELVSPAPEASTTVSLGVLLGMALIILRRLSRA